jgi:hypothetical protein
VAALDRLNGFGGESLGAPEASFVDPVDGGISISADEETIVALAVLVAALGAGFAVLAYLRVPGRFGRVQPCPPANLPSQIWFIGVRAQSILPW